MFQPGGILRLGRLVHQQSQPPQSQPPQSPQSQLSQQPPPPEPPPACFFACFTASPAASGIPPDPVAEKRRGERKAEAIETRNGRFRNSAIDSREERSEERRVGKECRS